MISLKRFRTPSARRSPGYFWSCGREFDSAKMRVELENMVKKNIRTVCLHPVPANFRIDIATTMAPEYLSEPYNKIIGEVVQICKELGMNYYLYDEGGWPSGGACGQVWASNPELFTRQSIVKDGNGTWKILRETPTPELAAPYPNLLEKGATEKFIELTHEAHRKYCSDHFGKTIYMAFTDEPTMPSCWPGERLGYCSDLFDEFRKRKGYSIEDHLADMLYHNNPTEMRGELAEHFLDYCDVMNELFTERFLLPLRTWCRENDIISAGHFGGEDEWFNWKLHHFGDPLHSLRQLDCPGVDMIWHQLYPGERLHPFPKLASSAARQIGKKEVLGEMFAIYGGGLMPDRMKFLLDYMLICGVNTFVFSSTPHYADIVNLSGGRPSFGKSDPMWGEFDLWHTYVGRMSELLTSGKGAVDTAFYLDQRHFMLGNREAEYSIINALQTVDLLRNRQIDFDFVDDEIILQAKLKNGKLCIGLAQYKQLVVNQLNRMTPAAKARLEELKKQNFPVLTPDEIDTIAPTLTVTPATWKLQVHKRVLGNGQAGYFVLNTSGTTVKATLTADEKNQPVSVADWERAGFYAVDSANGSWQWEFAPYESRFFLCGEIATIAPPEVPVECVKKLTKWQLRPLVKHFVAQVYQEKCNTPAMDAALGDWGKFLGEDFSGTAEYTTTFRYDGKGGIRFIDLGQVNYTCSVKLNGITVGRSFFSGSVFDLQGALKEGVNKLTVTVSNTLANALRPKEVQDFWKGSRKVPSPYNIIQLDFESEALPSGLFGPVRLMK
ncbi:MAG: hypothetical protein E7057_05440 [Lentisphaerae bacterium]|nr:hypothetical protein [Lentisphaerota bacterium]